MKFFLIFIILLLLQLQQNTLAVIVRIDYVAPSVSVSSNHFQQLSFSFRSEGPSGEEQQKSSVSHGDATTKTITSTSTSTTTKCTSSSSSKYHTKRGNSIRMWRDYFTNAETHAVDIMPEGMSHGEERIQTYIVDRGSEKDLLELAQTIGDISSSSADDDEFICDDDGSHIAAQEHQVFPHVFVILRCIRTEEDKKLWRRCYVSIRYFYHTAKIVIIDDNSLLTDEFDQQLEGDTTIIKSDFTGSGEVLPFYYYLKHHWADRMIMMHDSMFIKRPFTEDEFAGKVKFFWHFDRHEYNNTTKIDEFLQVIPHSSQLLSLRKNSNEWNGCFGLAMVLDWSTLKELDDKYGIVSLLIHFIQNREARKAYERIFGLVVFNEQLVTKSNCSMFGAIHDYQGCWLADFDWQLKNQHLYPYAVMKTWSGR